MFIWRDKHATSTLNWPGPRRSLSSMESLRGLETYLQARLLSIVRSSRSGSVEEAMGKLMLETLAEMFDRKQKPKQEEFLVIRRN